MELCTKAPYRGVGWQFHTAGVHDNAPTKQMSVLALHRCCAKMAR